MHIVVNVLLWFTYLISLFFAIFWFIVLLEDRPQKRLARLARLPTVSIVIPAYNEEKTIRDTVMSVIRLDYPKDLMEILIMNDGSTDRTQAIVEGLIAKHPGIGLRHIYQENAGKGAAMNRALKVAKGEYFICLDADSYVSKDALKRMLPHFTDERIAAVLPTLKVKDPKNMVQKFQWYEYIVNMFYKKLMSDLNCVHVAPGPFSIYRAPVLREVGGFDPNRNLTEDLEITLRLQSRNYRLVQLLDVEIETQAPTTYRQLYTQRNRWFKGALLNALAYKRMLFNRAYGDFGMIQMPTIMVSGILALIIITSTVYYALKPYIKYLWNLSYVDYDIWTFIHDFTPNLHLLDLNFMTLAVAFIMIMITGLVIYKSHQSTNERVLQFGFTPIFLYLFFYYLVISAMWVGIAFDLATGRRQHW
ncbi:glycosyltransferase [Candidatus Woesearchaeota archaeon]|nr:glycosyltransferase [Candidatus Woesearchaeota archaeon]